MKSPPKRSRVYLLLLILIMIVANSLNAQPLQIIYPTPSSGSNTFINYYWDLLEDAIQITEKEYGPLKTKQIDDYMNHLRAMEELSKGAIDVYVRAYITDEFKESLDLVPFPLDKGMLGNRISFIHGDSQSKLANIKTLEDLKTLVIGQGLVWLDSDILEAAEMNVIRSSTYDGLFPMLENKRIDLFPRGSNEIIGEYTARKDQHPNITIDQHLLLSYQMSFYFITRADEQGKQLNKRLLLGLHKLKENGSFDKKYNKLKADALAGVNLNNRTRIKIPNKFYNRPGYKINDPSFWDDLAKERGLE